MLLDVLGYNGHQEEIMPRVSARSAGVTVDDIGPVFPAGQAVAARSSASLMRAGCFQCSSMERSAARNDFSCAG